jgi:hypothetical protein
LPIVAEISARILFTLILDVKLGRYHHFCVSTSTACEFSTVPVFDSTFAHKQANITGKRPKNESRSYSHSHYGASAFYGYNNLVLLELDDEELISSDNPIDIVLYEIP